MTMQLQAIEGVQSRQYLEKLFDSESAAHAVFAVDGTGAFLRTSPLFDELLRFGSGELVGRMFMDLIETDHALNRHIPFMASHYFVRSAEKPVLMHFLCKDGLRKSLYLHAVVLEDGDGRMVEAMGFVEELQEQEMTLRTGMWEARQNLEYVLNNSGDGIFVCSSGGYITLANEALAAILGRERDAMPGLHIMELGPVAGMYTSATGEEIIIDEAYLQEQVVMANRLFEQGTVTYRSYFLRSDNCLVPVEGTFSVLYGPNQNHRGSMGIVRDITHRLTVEHKLEQSHEFLENIFRTSGDGIIVTDALGSIVRANAAVHTILDYLENDLRGRQFYDLVHHSQKKRQHLRTAEHMMASLTKQGFVRSYDIMLDTKNGAGRMVEVNGGLLRDAGNKVTGAVLCLRDISERIDGQAQLLRTRRLETISTIAAGVAHDFDAILTTLLGNISLAQGTQGIDDEVFGYLSQAEKGAMRAKDLIRQLLTFSEDGSIHREPGSIVEVLTGAAEDTFKCSSIRCEFSISSGLWAHAFDHAMMEQMLRSLLINAEQSMPDGGVVKISVNNKTVTSDDGLQVRPGPYIEIRIQDQGIGILNEYIQDMFSHYLRQGRKRSGLMLATAYAIINKHDGLISVESDFGHGAVCSVYLPASPGTHS